MSKRRVIGLFRNVGKKLNFVYMVIGYLGIFYTIGAIVIALGLLIFGEISFKEWLFATLISIAVGFGALVSGWIMTGFTKIIIYHERVVDDEEDLPSGIALIVAITIFCLIMFITAAVFLSGVMSSKSEPQEDITVSKVGMEAEETVEQCFGKGYYNTLTHLDTVKDENDAVYDVFLCTDGSYIYVERDYPYRIYQKEYSDAEMILIWKNGKSVTN